MISNIKPEIMEAVESLWHHKLRTMLTLLGMIFGVGAVIAMISIGSGAEQEVLKAIDSMGLRNIIVKEKKADAQQLKEIRQNSMGLTIQDLNTAMDTVPGVETSCALKKIQTYSMYSIYNSIEAAVYGITPNYFQLANLSVETGRILTDLDQLYATPACILGSQIALKLFPEGEIVGQSIKINHVWLTVVGVLRPKDSLKKEIKGISLKNEQNDIYLPLETALRLFQFDEFESEIDELRIQVKPGIAIRSAAVTFDNLLKRRHKNSNDYELIIPEELLNSHKKTQNVFNIVMACIAGISLLVGGIGIMNIMLATVLERTKEIGLRRALGATQLDIRNQFLLETLVISGVGGVIGILFGISLSFIISMITEWPISWSFSAIILSVGVCAAVGTIFGLYPAVQASKLSPIEALRHD
jgi:putative ABC transport system permease protein